MFEVKEMFNKRINHIGLKFTFVPKGNLAHVKRLFYLLFVFAAFCYQANKSTAQKWVVVSGGSLRVDGKTNINNFSCDITNYKKPDTITVNRGASQVIFLKGSMALDVQCFNCHNPIMTADLRKTLKSKEYPQLVITFLTMNSYPDVTTPAIKGLVLIELAGVSRRYEVDYKVGTTDQGYINLVGVRKVNFSDFNLTPPRKLGGMIKTNNELDVVFTIRLRELDG